MTDNLTPEQRRVIEAAVDWYMVFGDFGGTISAVRVCEALQKAVNEYLSTTPAVRALESEEKDGNTKTER